MYVDDLKSRTYFNHLTYATRISLFIRTKRRRFLLLFLFFLFFNPIANVMGFILARLERSGRKYKRRWIQSKFPNVMHAQTALDTNYEATKITSQSQERVCEVMLRADRQLKEGVTRAFIIKVLEQVDLLRFKSYIDGNEQRRADLIRKRS